MIYTLDYRLHEVAGYINWLYFFHAWGFPSRYGSISQVHGCEACWANWMQSFPEEERDKAAEAIRLFKEAQTVIDEMDERFRSHALVGLFDANSHGDDILLWTDEGDEVRLPMLRQQSGELCLCLSDFVLPLGAEHDTIGLFASSVDSGLEKSYEGDDYRHLLCQTLADRLAEATAERAHEYTRKQLWAYAPDEDLTVEQLFREAYQGKRPAVGYPSLPDQSLNFLIDEVLHLSSIGISLTESGAMMPHASTSGLMLAHPEARHFSVGRIGTDQVEDYARRRGMNIERAKQFLTSNLSEKGSNVKIEV